MEKEDKLNRREVCGCACVHLALPPTPLPSPPRPPGRRFSAAGSAGDTRQMPGQLSARSSWPETATRGREMCLCVCVSAAAERAEQLKMTKKEKN